MISRETAMSTEGSIFGGIDKLTTAGLEELAGDN